MNAKTVLTLIILSPFLTITALGQRTLQPDETRQILQRLTSQPRSTWLPAGTIQAIHQEYGSPKTLNETEIGGEIDKQIREYKDNPKKRELAEEGQKLKLEAMPFNVRYRMSNEFTMISQVTVKYDGDRFYWQIDVSSRKDSVKPDAALAGNFMTEQFDRARRGESDFGRLATLATGGRSTATTILSLYAVRFLRSEASLQEHARKLLSFTDNRQDASLQAGHFNDFVEVALLRAAIYRALPETGCLDHASIAGKVVETLSSGGIFGEMALIEDSPRSADAIAELRWRDPR